MRILLTGSSGWLGQTLAPRLGATTLLDVLQAEKDETDVRLNYIAALTERASALVALEQSAAFWDIKFPLDHSGSTNRLNLPSTPARGD